MKKITQTILIFAFLFGAAPVFAERSKVGFRYPRTFKSYIAEKYKDEKKVYVPNKLNQPRFRISAGNFPEKKESAIKTSTTKKFATPSYQRSTRSQVQRAGIFCRFVENRVPDSECLRTIDTNTTKPKYSRASRYRFVGTTKPKVAKKSTKETNYKKRTFSNLKSFSRK